MQEYFIVTFYQSAQRLLTADLRSILTNELTASAENPSKKRGHYCCITTYVEDAPAEYFGLNQPALEQAVDIDALDICRDCEVNGLEAVMGELVGKTYLCWTISPTYSCVLEYTAGSISEADIFHMAESVARKPSQ